MHTDPSRHSLSTAARCAALTLLLGVALPAQTHTAHLIDNPASNVGQNIPIAGGHTAWDEARSHFYFPAAFLPPSGALLTGIEFVASTNFATPYERFEISFDHTANPGLSLTFANNLTSPQLVFQQTPGTIPWTSGWTPITFATPFAYDGTSNLVMEVVKVLDRPNNPTITAVNHRSLVWPRRSDLPPPIWSYGTYGSGAATAASAVTTYSTHLLIRLVWAGTPTLTIDSTRDTSSSSNRSYFHVGATATATTRGNPGDAFLSALAVDLFPAGVPIPGVVGELWLSGAALLGIGGLDPAGLGATSLTIPNNPLFVGVHIYFQSATAGVAGATFTNVVDGIVAS